MCALLGSCCSIIVCCFVLGDMCFCEQVILNVSIGNFVQINDVNTGLGFPKECVSRLHE